MKKLSAILFHHFSLRIISIMLIFALLGGNVLGNKRIVFADPVIEDLIENTEDMIVHDSTETELEEVVIENKEDIQILYEVESLRGENEKHYRLSDGSLMAAEYAMDVHYENEDGEWTDCHSANYFRLDSSH